MQTETVALTREKETLLITLWAKAGESLLPDSLLKDRFAAEAATRIDYDFAKLKVDRDLMVGLAMRASTIDGWARDFLGRHHDALVLHLGCGLDSRVFRIDPPASIDWYDIDYPDVIALRQKLYPARDGYHLTGSSVTEPGWIAGLPRDRPTMIVAEGLLLYLPEEEVPLLLERLVRHCRSGEIVFDAYSPFGLKLIAMQPSIKATGAVLRWSLDDPAELERQVPGLELVTELTAYDPDGYDPAQIARMSWPARFTMQFFSLIPPLARIGLLLRYRF
ncbi:Tetracenomycin polyketide synthesis O-methyltransferase TcmP [Bosea sp. 62]|uniref:class I SAM-dependent methyltransferase n=1 Tax=unclassified Bosea (in: a-proteobacteria) TaxID=2653178 RepID=UPI001258E295|nr:MULTISPECIES: class I SAM-dependent methyltransferase [unclassified Bosea (in: a-proteobacteria)]CAD5254431.1 Tetracenomycin polyketide synthesis O-methyltransferase TcmP [Bosea sp. 21B]CAD5286128.1 Tetracenomycin polyketide synthesis O-methyltransferase TcmP [Bosea sp. 7B]CAD5301394.1 Tetracenomycin polyketide synthesis O-methyltransferase TcmP [Bosea sp. 46]VVT57496.1 Tetracenomycin polyketide synthesis O-methyltransferase TcmP [Bosea sp. EC-HK365B]VXB69533.1 Tetracenomycin polyketide syn